MLVLLAASAPAEVRPWGEGSAGTGPHQMDGSWRAAGEAALAATFDRGAGRIVRAPSGRPRLSGPGRAGPVPAFWGTGPGFKLACLLPAAPVLPAALATSARRMREGAVFSALWCPGAHGARGPPRPGFC